MVSFEPMDFNLRYFIMSIGDDDDDDDDDDDGDDGDWWWWFGYWWILIFCPCAALALNVFLVPSL